MTWRDETLFTLPREAFVVLLMVLEDMEIPLRLTRYRPYASLDLSPGGFSVRRNGTGLELLGTEPPLAIDLSSALQLRIVRHPRLPGETLSAQVLDPFDRPIASLRSTTENGRVEGDLWRTLLMAFQEEKAA